MWRALITAGAVAALTAPALAAERTIIEEQTITRDVVTIPQSGSTVTTTVVAPTAPPPVRIEPVPPPPGPAVVWTPGHWQWVPGPQTYTWVGGRYIEPPRPQAAWIPGHWVQEPRGWVWLEGRWN